MVNRIPPLPWGVIICCAGPPTPRTGPLKPNDNIYYIIKRDVYTGWASSNS